MHYTKSHEWISVNGNIATIGITDYAMKEMGEVVYVELPSTNSIIKSQDEVVVLESTKAAADVSSPLSGKVVEVNTDLKEDLSLLNSDPQEKGWLYRVELKDPKELDQLLSQKAYLKLVN